MNSRQNNTVTTDHHLSTSILELDTILFLYFSCVDSNVPANSFGANLSSGSYISSSATKHCSIVDIAYRVVRRKDNSRNSLNQTTYHSKYLIEHFTYSIATYSNNKGGDH